jgi:protein-L-isoaspartate(D-aspartate) O-methyltransferase
MSTRGGLDELRDELVDRLCAVGVMRDERVVQAFRSVPRHLFLPGEPERAYRDEAMPTKWAPDGRPISSSSQPMMAVMLEQLEVGFASTECAPPRICTTPHLYG